MIPKVVLMASNSKVTNPGAVFAAQILQMNSDIKDFSSGEKHFKPLL